MTVASILAQSSNIGTITLAQLLGRERLTSWLGKFRFGGRPNIDFPGETQGSSRVTGPAPRSARCRSATASPSRPCRWRPPTRRWRTGRLEAAAPRPVEAAYGSAASSRAVSEQLMSMMRDVVLEGTAQAAVEEYQVAGDRDRRQAGPARRLLDLPLRRLVRRRRAGEATRSS